MSSMGTSAPTPAPAPGGRRAEGITQQQAPEARLRAAAVNGDRAAFATLYQTYRDDVFRYLLRRCHGDRYLAEDLTQDTFARALAKLSGYRETGRPFRAWLVAIAGNLLVDHWRSGWHRHHVPWSDLAQGTDNRAVPAPAELGAEVDPAVTVIARDRQRRASRTLARAVAALTDRQRQVLVLRYLGGRSVAETADALGLAEGAVAAAAYRARNALAEDPALAELR